MARIAYFDHSYHRKTLSTRFIPEMLTRHGNQVDFFWDESWNGGPSVRWEAVAQYDAIIMFQSWIPVQKSSYAELHPNVTYIPMLDQFHGWRGPVTGLKEFFKPFEGCKVLNFSSALHALVNGFGVASKFVRYYKPVFADNQCCRDGLRGFFWLRSPDEISWQTVRKLIGHSEFRSVHIHLAQDPQTDEASLPSAEDIRRYNITTSTWFKDRAGFENVLNSANVFFASRAEEGIGQAMLEAFSRGQCVVAPDHGTMNEYILHGINGLLFDIENPVGLDFSTVPEMGAMAKKAANIGYQNWLASEDGVVKYLLCRNEECYDDSDKNRLYSNNKPLSKMISDFSKKIKNKF